MAGNKKKLLCPGFSAAGVSCGIKKGKALDLALILSDVPAVTAGVFTRNRLSAAPVKLDKKLIEKERAG